MYAYEYVYNRNTDFSAFSDLLNSVVIVPFSPHPYLFFNQDHITMTFLGFYINSAGDLVDPQTNRTLERGLMSKQLRNGLEAQRVDFTANANNWKK